MITEQGRRLSSALSLVLASGFAASAAGQTTATFTGPTTANWNVPGNWDINAVPLNNPPALFNAIIGGNRTVTIDMPGASSITGMSHSQGSTLLLSGGRQFSVNGVSLIGGNIAADGLGTIFQSNVALGSFNGGSKLTAVNGAQIILGGVNYADGTFGGDRFVADGVGSLIRLPALASLSMTLGCCGPLKYIRARNSGLIDLPTLTSVTGTESEGGRIYFIPESNGTISLPKLRNATSTVFQPLVPSWALPLLENTQRCEFVLAPGRVMDLQALSSASRTTFTIGDNATLNAPQLFQVPGSVVVLTPLTTLNAPEFVNINDARLSVTAYAGTKKLKVAATAVTSTERGGEVYAAMGPGALIDLSTVKTAAWTLGCCGPQKFFRAKDSGAIDLSGLTSLTGTESEGGRIFVQPSTGGTIDLDSLQTAISVEFEPRIPVFSLPSLTSATNGAFFVDIFNTVNLPLLPSTDNITLKITPGGTINALSLTSFVRSTLDLRAAAFLNAPLFTNINDSTLRVFDGRTFAVAATAVNSTTRGGEMYVADGPGSLLDLSTVKSFAMTLGCCGPQKFIRLRNGGTIDMSGAERIYGTASEDGRIFFEVSAPGLLLLSSPQLSQVAINASGTSAEVHVDTPSFGPRSSIRMDLVSRLQVLGSLRPTMQAEADFNLAAAKVILDGEASLTRPQIIEIGGTDSGTPSGTIAANFQYGQLTVGQPGRPTVAVLRDDINNGNRGAAPGATEQIHMQGFPAEDGLRILAGSSLYLNNLTAYAVINNNWVRLNDLIPPNQEFIPFDAGRLYRGAPAGFIAPITVGPRGTWLRTNNDPSAVAPTAIDLAALGILPGSEISIERLGTWATINVWPETLTAAMGLFSSSNTVLPATNLNRVPGAIDAGTDIATESTSSGSLATDISQDFVLAAAAPTVLTVPNQATSLFVAVPDRFYGDNTDADQNLLIRLTLLKGPCVGDLFRDGFVDDSDFSVFAPAYDILDCTDPAMASGCPADLNRDGLVDDADFSIFVVAYDQLVCP